MADDWPPLNDFAWEFQVMETNPVWAFSNEELNGFPSSPFGANEIPGDLSTAPNFTSFPYDTVSLDQTPSGLATPATATYGDISTVSGLHNEQRPSPVGASTTIDRLRTELKKFRCLVLGCERAYVNKRDLTRHSKKHTRPFTFDCPAVGCGKTGNHANYLRYKFVEHLRKGHRKPTMWACLVASCDAQAKDLSLLVEHLRDHESDVLGDKVVSAICEASENRGK